jgi:hypothetical protein
VLGAIYHSNVNHHYVYQLHPADYSHDRGRGRESWEVYFDTDRRIGIIDVYYSFFEPIFKMKINERLHFLNFLAEKKVLLMMFLYFDIFSLGN